MLQHVATLLAELIGDEHTIGDVQLLGPAEKDQLLRAWNDTALPFDMSATMSDLVYAQAIRTPHAIAVATADEALTYAALASRVDELAFRLQAIGVMRGDRVGICIPRNADMIVGMLAILRVGAAYVPLDPAYPTDRLAFILEDAEPRAVLVHPETANVLPHRVLASINVRDIKKGYVAEFRADDPAQPTDTAYLIYTSGSTGKPKGVEIMHRNAVAFITWAQTVFSRDDLAGVLAGTSICFDLSVFEIFVTLSSGGTVLVVADGLSVAAAPKSVAVTLLNTVPSVISELVNSGAIPSSVRTVNLAGEPLKQALVERIYEAANVERVYDLYGPSETTTYSTYTLRTRGGEASIGRPLGNTQVYVLDAQQRLLPTGIAGELYIAGAGVARGYLGRPELTSERFVANPFAPDDRVYRTGDLVRWAENGMLTYLGRLDHQVKVRGFRIELGEIELHLTRHPAVREAVAVARQDDDLGPKQLVAYFSLRDGMEADNRTLRAYLSARLPEHAVPSVYVQLPALPLTQNGKVDRKALPAPSESIAAAMSEYVAPRSSTEETLCNIWAKVLRLPRVGINDNFFEIGGDSILLIQIAARARDAGLNVSVSGILKNASVAELAASLAQQPAVADTRFVITSGEVPLTPIQRWFFELDLPERNFWNQTFLFATVGELDTSALSRAVTALISHHQALRTRFTFTNDSWTPSRTTAGETNELPLWIEDLSTVTDGDLPSALLERNERASRSLDIARGSNLRFVYYRLGQERGARLLIAHSPSRSGWCVMAHPA